MGLALAAGLLTGAQVAIQDPLPVVPLLLLLAALLVLTLLVPSIARQVVICAVVGLLIGGGVASQRAQNTPPPPGVLPDMLSVRLTSDPDVTARGYMARGVWVDATGVERETLLFLPAFPAPHRGMTLETFGIFDDTTAEVFFADAVRVTRQPGWLEQRRHAVRRSLEHTLVRHVGGAASALSLGLLTGDDSALTSERRDDLRTAGLSHLTAVSGWNVALVAAAAAAVIAPLPLPRRATWVLQSLVIVAFVWLVGADPPVLRAGIMAQTALLARWFGRPSHTVTALLLAAAIMAVESPSALHSISFRLSLAATAAMIVAAEITCRGPEWRLRALREASITSGLAGIATAPILAGSSGSLALWTIPANVFVAPLVPLATITAVITCAVAQIPYIGNPLANLVGTVAWAIGSLVLWSAEVAAALPGAQQGTSLLSRSLLSAITIVLLAAFALTLPEGAWVRRELRLSGRLRSAQAPVIAACGLGTLLLGALVSLAV